jgi:hypothetical protein
MPLKNTGKRQGIVHPLQQPYNMGNLFSSACYTVWLPAEPVLASKLKY